MNSTVIRPREKILVVLHWDGWCEVFAKPHVDIKIVNMPYVANSVEGELAAQRFLANSLPFIYRELYDDKPRAFDMARKLTVEEIDYALSWKRMSRTLDALRKDLSDD